jgi:predicted dehydrogenase
LRLAIAGCGDVAWRYLVGASRLERAGASVVALCDPDAERLTLTASEFGIAGMHRSLDALLAASPPHALLNLTPTPTHASVTRAALEAGVHVYSEKPLATTLREGRELQQLADDRGVVLLCAPAISVFPVWRMAKRLLDSDAIGRPRAIRAQFDMGPLPWRRHATGASWFTQPDVGPLRDIGIYGLHAMLDLFGPPVAVTCQSTELPSPSTTGEAPAADKPSTAPDAFSLALEFEDGRLGSLQTGFFVHASLTPWMEVYGDHGTLAISMRDDRAPLRICRIERNGDAPGWTEIARDTILRTLGADQQGSDDWFDYLAGVEELIDVLRTPRHSPLSADRACDVLSVIDLANAARIG